METTDSMNKKLSVIIPNYNHGHFLKNLLPSLFAQSRPPDEVVIVDDGSTDSSVEIIECFQKKEKRVRLFKNGVNKGVVYSLNFALDKAEGDWVTFPSADNFVLPGMYEKSMQMLLDYPHAAVCCSDPVTFDETTGVTEFHKLHLPKIPRYYSPEEFVQIAAQNKFSIGSLVHTVIVKKSALKEVGLGSDYFIEKLKWHCDFFAINAVAFRYGFCYLPERLAIFRKDPHSYSRNPVAWKVRKKVYQELLSVLSLPKNHDIKSAFKKSAILGEFSYSILLVLISNPRKYEYFTLSLTNRLLKRYFRYILGKICKAILSKKLYHLLKNKTLLLSVLIGQL